MSAFCLNSAHLFTFYLDLSLPFDSLLLCPDVAYFGLLLGCALSADLVPHCLAATDFGLLSSFSCPGTKLFLCSAPRAVANSSTYLQCGGPESTKGGRTAREGCEEHRGEAESTGGRGHEEGFGEHMGAGEHMGGMRALGGQKALEGWRAQDMG